MKELFQAIGAVIIIAVLASSIIYFAVNIYHDIKYKNEMIELEKEKLRLEIEIKKRQLDL